MKKIYLLVSVFIVFSCSEDNDNANDEIENTAPIFGSLVFEIPEHSEAGTAIGNVNATDAENDDLTFSLDTDLDVSIDETTGALTTGEDLLLDFETTNSLSAEVTVFDGKQLVDGTITINLTDINEYEALSDEQRELIEYFQYLTLWQGPSSTPLNFTSRWEEPMKLYLDGQISTQFRANVETVLEEYNVLFENSDFNISLVQTLEESNAHLYFGEAADIEELWADVFEIIDGKTFSGYAITANNNSVLSNSRIWVSNPLAVLFKHELGHALGFGHSDKCDMENSFMCSNIDPEHDFLEVEKSIIQYAYDNEFSAGSSASEIELFLANQLILE